ncbi:MAG: DUF1501 domain-containing protein [Planctomycetota bacterium]|nr:DUF1501 domain-containing protein [Planctomycetota bacterium]
MKRREHLKWMGGAAALGWFDATSSISSLQARSAASLPGAGSADSCIFLWLGGGACHIDTFDPKRVSRGKKDPGSYYPAVDTAVPGVQLCEHLSRTAKLLDRCAVVRTLNHNVVDEHAAATNRVHTGRPPADSTVYPSIGSIVSHQLGAVGDGVPAYVVAGYPSASRGPGFLGAKHSYVYLTDTELGPAGLRRPTGLSDQRFDRRKQLVNKLRQGYSEKHIEDERIQDYVAASDVGAKLAGPKFMSVFQLSSEPDSLRQEYGGEFGQRCLMARRLVESGVRFVEVSFNLNFINGTGWDTHNEGQLQQHVMIDQLDQALSALIRDLESRKRLDRTLVVVATEFGRPPEFDGGGGRGHQGKAFSGLLAGGGLKLGQAIGATDELGRKIESRPVSIPDFHATIHHALGINPSEELYDGDRPVPITDRGQPIAELFS